MPAPNRSASTSDNRTRASGSLTPTAHLTDRVARGVACLPHGFSQGREGVRLSEASRIPGVSYNDLSEEDAYDAVSGNAAVNALPIQLEKMGSG